MTEDRGEAALRRLLGLVDEFQAGRLGEAELGAALSADADVLALARRGAGFSFERAGKVIDFGAGSQMGDVQIRGVAGRDIVNVTINVQGQPAPAAPAGLPAEEVEHRRALIAEHRRMLRVLELQAAELGIYTPPHITVEIEDLRRKIAGLRREIGEG